MGHVVHLLWGLPLLYVSSNFRIYLQGSLLESRKEDEGACDSFIMLFIAITIYACRVFNIMQACSQSEPNTSPFSIFHPQIKLPCLSNCESTTPRNARMTISMPSNRRIKLIYTVDVWNHELELTSCWRGEMGKTQVDL